MDSTHKLNKTQLYSINQCTLKIRKKGIGRPDRVSLSLLSCRRAKQSKCDSVRRSKCWGSLLAVAAAVCFQDTLLLSLRFLPIVRSSGTRGK